MRRVPTLIGWMLFVFLLVGAGLGYLTQDEGTTDESIKMASPVSWLETTPVLRVWGYNDQGELVTGGSCFVVDYDETSFYFMTAAHVVTGVWGATKWQLEYPNSDEPSWHWDAEKVASLYWPTKDVAVLKAPRNAFPLAFRQAFLLHLLTFSVASSINRYTALQGAGYTGPRFVFFATRGTTMTNQLQMYWYNADGLSETKAMTRLILRAQLDELDDEKPERPTDEKPPMWVWHDDMFLADIAVAPGFSGSPVYLQGTTQVAGIVVGLMRLYDMTVTICVGPKTVQAALKTLRETVKGH